MNISVYDFTCRRQFVQERKARIFPDEVNILWVGVGSGSRLALGYNSCAMSFLGHVFYCSFSIHWNHTWATPNSPISTKYPIIRLQSIRAVKASPVAYPATARRLFANGFILGHMWTALLWPLSSCMTASYRPVP